MNEHGKPHLSFHEQLVHLKEHHKLDLNPNSYIAEEILKSMSYYDLINGYKEHFMVNDIYGDSNIIDLFDYSFTDRTFQGIIFKYSLLVETRFRYVMSNVVAEDYGEHESDYLNLSKYKIPRKPKRRDKLNETLSDIRGIYNPRTPNKIIPNPTKHYILKYGYIPPWILFKNVTFSSLTDLYSFMPISTKVKIANEMIPIAIIDDYKKTEFLKNGLTLIRKYRNNIAHDLKFINVCNSKYGLNKAIFNYPGLSELVTKSELKDGQCKNDHFALIVSITVLLNNIFLQNKLQNELLDFSHKINILGIKNSAAKYLINIKIPNDFPSRIKNYINIAYKDIFLQHN